MKTYKKFYAAFAVILVVLTLIPQAVFAAGFPKHENYVADAADILSEETINLIKDTNKTLSGDVQLTIAVCTVASTEGKDIADYARDLFSEWKLGEGVLLLLAKDDNNYYFVPSTGVEDILTNEAISTIRDKYFEADFSNGTYERAVQKAVMMLKTTLIAGVEARAAAAEAEAAEQESENPSEEKGTPAGNAIVTFFKVILWIVIIAALLFVGLFVWAMFNEDVAALFQKFIFRRNRGGTRYNAQQQPMYDDRLYGNRSMPQRPAQGQRRPNPNGSYGNGGYPANAGYLGDGRSSRQGYGPNGYPQQQMQGQPNYARGGYPAQGQYMTQNPNMQQRPYPQQQMPQNQGYGYPQQNGYTNNGYAQQGQYPQQNPYGGQPNNGYYAQGGQQGYPQQTPQNPYGQPVQQQNYNNHPGYGAQQNNNDATVQFNIPRRS